MPDGPEVTLAKATEAAITAAQSGLVVPDFTLVRAYYPNYGLEDLPSAGVVTVVMLGGDRDCIARSGSWKGEVPVQVAVQKKVTQTDVEGMDKYMVLWTELRGVVAGLNLDNFSFLRDESLKDENGTPYRFAGLREQSVFEAIFTAYFLTTGS